MNDWSINNSAVRQGAAVPQSDAVSRFMTGVHLWMACALVVTGLAAIFTVGGPAALNPALTRQEAINLAMSMPLGRLILGNSISYIVLIVAELALVFFLAARINKMSKTAAMAAFFVFATVNGLMLASIFLVYSLPSIATSFFICAGMFVGMTVFGMVTKKDLTKAGSICFMALIGVIIASVVNIFLKSSMMSWIISLAAVGIFTVLTAYDTQKLKYLGYESEEGSDAYTKHSIYGALTLYLDFINLFLALLRIFGRARD